MPVSDLIRLKVANLTPQQLADMALDQHRTARYYGQRGLRGDDVSATVASIEAFALADLSASKARS